MRMKPVVLCADDYAMSEGVSRGILELARIGRVSATSAMTNSPGWPGLAAPLREMGERIGIGLHLALTWGRPLGAMPRLAPGGEFPPLVAIVRGALGGSLPLPEIAGEIERQLDAFSAASGRAPDFLDGHQHVHALPGIRGVVIGVLARRDPHRRIWLRDPGDSLSAILRRGGPVGKALLVGALARGFARTAGQAGFATNAGFSGFSSFDPAQDQERAFVAYLRSPGPRHLVMCHPGHVDDGAGLDGVVASRAGELAYLSSPRFGDLLARREVTLVKVPTSALSGP